jgi:hypothetical protein
MPLATGAPEASEQRRSRGERRRGSVQDMGRERLAELEPPRSRGDSSDSANDWGVELHQLAGCRRARRYVGGRLEWPTSSSTAKLSLRPPPKPRSPSAAGITGSSVTTLEPARPLDIPQRGSRPVGCPGARGQQAAEAAPRGGRAPSLRHLARLTAPRRAVHAWRPPSRAAARNRQV